MLDARALVVKAAGIVVDFGGAPTMTQYLDVLLYLIERTHHVHP